MDKSQRQALEARFPDELIKKRRGSFGKEIFYVEGSAVLARLNDALDSEWSFTIVEHFVLETGEVVVHGRLSALGRSRCAFGRGVPAVSKETGEVLSMADAYKSAATDALKKCASFYGVALYLYSDEITDAPDEKNGNEKRKLPSKPSGDRLSQKQLSTIWSMARALNLDADAVRRRTMELYGVQPENLSKADASALITALEKRRAA